LVQAFLSFPRRLLHIRTVQNLHARSVGLDRRPILVSPRTNRHPNQNNSYKHQRSRACKKKNSPISSPDRDSGTAHETLPKFVRNCRHLSITIPAKIAPLNRVTRPLSCRMGNGFWKIGCFSYLTSLSNSALAGSPDVRIGYYQP